MIRSDRSREQIRERLTDPEPIHFPEGYTFSTSWRRAQSESAIVAPVDKLRWRVVIGDGSHREVLFTILGGDVRAECSCPGWKHHGFCAHIARLWIRWTRDDLCVTDADTGRTHRHPPAWIRVSDANTGEA